MNLRSDSAVFVQVGMYAVDGTDIVDQIPLLFIFPTEGKWKKFYISLGGDINNQKYAGNTFKIFMTCVTVDRSDSPKFYFDNFKIVYL